MGFIFLIVLGAIFGWMAAIILGSENRKGLQRNISAGIGGACIAGLLVSPLVGGGSLTGESYSITALKISLAGALLAIACANVLRGVQLR